MRRVGAPFGAATRRSRIRPLFAILLAIGLWPCTGTAQDLYTIDEVSVDETAATAVEAQQAALASAQMIALGRLLRQLTDAADHGRLPSVTQSMVDRTVFDYTVDRERSTAGRYLATVTVRFRPEPVRDLLLGNGISIQGTVARDILVLPVFRAAPDAAAQLWEDTNPWRFAWSERPDEEAGPVTVVAPIGDFQEITMVSAEQAAGGDLDALRRIAERYGVEEVLVATATVTDPSVPRVEISTRRVQPMTGGLPVTTAFSLAGAGTAGLDSVLIRGVGDVEDRLARSIRAAGTAVAGPAQTIVVLAQLDGFASWIATRSRLESTALIQTFRIQAISHDLAQLQVLHTGSPQQLAEVLAEQGLTLQEASGYWTLAPSGTATGFGLGG